MNLRAILDVLAILSCSVYGTIPLFWLVVHPSIEKWRARGRRAFLLIVPIWAAIIGITFFILWPFRFAHFYATWLAWVPGGLFFLSGFATYSAAFKSFDHTQVSGLAELEPHRHRQQLVTSGIRARVRHPIYLGHLCEIVGWCIGTGLVALFVLAAFAMLTGTIMIRMEDRELEARFGEAYREYRSRVPAVLPRSLSRS
ncbi:MAG: isoprenylcysteine carboxylmethyltransferase family protein [Acidobacteriota bacterium]|nr:isoprenylcysteine carboxylmethyltransferase family protein [Acidobacteriota bacterium]